MTAKRKETGAAYLRVGTTIYKRVQQPLSSGRSIEILLAWNVETLRQDFGKDYLARIPKYDGFCTVPDHTNYRREIHGFLNRNEHFFIIAVGIVILLDENENVVNIDFNLLDEFNFKNNVVGDVLFFAGGLAIFPFIPQVLVATEIVLKVTFAQNFIPSKVIKRR